MAEETRIVIFDTTLRDGEQSPGASMTVEEKLKVAHQLAALKVDIIEAGFPISSRGDFEAVSQIAKEVKGPIVAGLSRAVDADIDTCWEAVKHAERHRIHTFIATSDIHLQHKLKKTRDEVLKLAVAAVKRAKGCTQDVEFSPEDATRSDFKFLAQVVGAAIEAGATTINIPDTVGYALPQEFGSLIERLLADVPALREVTLSVHCHNDLGLAVANSLEAVRRGARQVECTVNGIGERAGNASLEELVMILRTRSDQLPFVTGVETTQIHRTSRLVSELTGMYVQPNKAIVGGNAFAHEAGIHQHGVLQDKKTYEIMDAASIGLQESLLVLGKHSGRHAFQKRLEEMGYQLSPEELNKAFVRFKELADRKKTITERDLEAIVADEVYAVPEAYRLDHFQVITGTGAIPTATVTVTSDSQSVTKSFTGDGPVDAIYKAVANCVVEYHSLVDFSIKAVTEGTDALGEVTVRISDKDGQLYIGRGSSTDVIEASAKAYIQAINKLVHGHGRLAGEKQKERPAGV